MNSFSRGIRNAFRNGIRTASVVLILALAIGLALAMLVARTAVETKIADVKSSIGNKITICPAGNANNFGGGGCQSGGMGMMGGGFGARPGENSAENSAQETTTLTTDDLAKVKKIAHITSVNATISASATAETDTNLKGETMTRRAPTQNSSAENSTDETSTFTMPIQVQGATNPEAVLESSSLNLGTGKMIDGNSSANEAVIGASLAENNNLKVGDKFTLWNTEITVKGILASSSNSDSTDENSANSSENPPRPGRNMSLDSIIIMPLATVQNLSDNSGEINSITATVDNVANTSAATSAIISALGTDENGNNVADVSSDENSAQTTLDSLASIKTTSTISVVACGAAAAVIIFLAMMMIVRERRNEIGVLKAIGAKSKTIIVQFVAESLVLTVLASAIGLGVGILAATPLTDTLVSSANSSAENSTNSADNSANSSTNSANSDSDSANNSSDNSAQNLPSGNNRPDFANFMNNSAQNISNITAKIDWTIVLWAFGSAIIIAAIGAAAASLIALRVRPAEAVRAE